MRAVSAFVLGLTLATGCSFIPSAQPTGPGGGSSAACSVSDPNLQLCLDFEGSVTPYAADTSGHDRSAATAEVAPVMRGNQQAVEVGDGAQIFVAGNDRPLMSVPLTVELWVLAAALPHEHAAIVDTDMFGLTLHGDGSISCDLGDASTRGGSLQPGLWTHVACTYDGEHVRVYAGGNVVGCHSDVDSGPAGKDSGELQLANLLDGGDETLSGAIDNVHVYGSLLGGDAICSLAERQQCIETCPADG